MWIAVLVIAVLLCSYRSDEPTAQSMHVIFAHDNVETLHQLVTSLLCHQQQVPSAAPTNTCRQTSAKVLLVVDAQHEAHLAASTLGLVRTLVGSHLAVDGGTGVDKVPRDARFVTVRKPYRGKRGDITGTERRLFALAIALSWCPDCAMVFTHSGTDGALLPYAVLEREISIAAANDQLPFYIDFAPLRDAPTHKHAWYGGPDLSTRLAHATAAGETVGDLYVGSPFWALPTFMLRKLLHESPHSAGLLLHLAKHGHVAEECYVQTLFAWHCGPSCRRRVRDPHVWMTWSRCKEGVSVGHACILVPGVNAFRTNFTAELVDAARRGIPFGRRFVDEHLDVLQAVQAVTLSLGGS